MNGSARQIYVVRLIGSSRVFRQRDRSLSQRRTAEEERRLAVEEALAELLASDTHYRDEQNPWIKGSACFVLEIALPPFSPPLPSVVEVSKQNTH